MKRIIKYQCKTDLKILRQWYQMQKWEVADTIGYTIRTLERIENENAVKDMDTARRLSELYGIKCEEHFFMIERLEEDWLQEQCPEVGRRPGSLIDDSFPYYCLYVRRLDQEQDCVAGKGCLVSPCSRTTDVRRLQQVNAERLQRRSPNLIVLNDGDEWDYWYAQLCIGKIYKVIVSERCMEERLEECLREEIVRQEDLMYFDGTSDLVFWGKKQKK